MIKFKIDDKEYIVPEKITIDHYVKIYKMKDLFDDKYFAAKLVNIVCEAPLEDLLESDYQEVNYIASHIMTLIPIKQPKFIDRFEIDGVHYGFFPKWQDLTFAEFVDMDTISTKKEDEILDLIHILSAVMYRPIISQRSEHDFDIENYDVKSMKVRAELFKKKLDISIVLGAQFFFINYAKRYFGFFQLSSIKTLSIWMKIKLAWSLRKMIWGIVFKKSTDGSLSSINSLTTTLLNTNTSIKKT
jgi:hypothetical protein